MGKIMMMMTAEKTKVESVLHILRKQSPLSLKQEKFCNTACVERFLKVKGDNVKKAAKLLRTCLTWRDSIGVESLIADEFSGELAEGVAYVAGHDDEARPVLVFRIKQDYQKFHSQKLFTRLMVFTLEVAVQTMARNTQQFVILFEASFFRSASAFMNIVLPTLKIVAEYYPGRLHKAFVIDPPSLFNYLWKGVRPFVELSNLTTIVSSTEFEDSISLDYNDFSMYPRAASLRFDPSSIPVHSSAAKIGACASSRFSFTVSHSFDSLKPWYLSLTSDPSSSKVGPTTTTTNSTSSILGPNPRSFSFASPIDRTPRGGGYNFNGGDKLLRKNFIPSTPLPQKSHNADTASVKQPRTPKPSFLHSPAAALFGRRETPAPTSHGSKSEKSREAFFPYFKFYRRPYDEMIYRSKMKPPLGGLISIVAPQHLRRRHMSVSQRF
ncbi:uncharacterized protein [Spinacia oleracea]|uniref:CRAL-TRIO domain-containing protein n=1 Tax=Spinacia oleracea TaxID=3562 RepID=A0A9R0K6C2_SPIOL|nr:uncharacterized protein LOC110799281 [Spinacia oleracea]